VSNGREDNSKKDVGIKVLQTKRTKESYRAKITVSPSKDAKTPLAPQQRVKERRRRSVLLCLEKTVGCNLARALTLSIAGMAPDWRERKRKSFLASQMQNINAIKMYTKHVVEHGVHHD